MQMGKALLLGLSMLAVSLAGCSSSGGSDGFSIKAGAPGTYTFEASGSADNYTWDLGDRLTILYGKKVTHTYDFKDGKVNVLLTKKTGAEKDEHRKQIVLGTGVNEQATFILEGSTNWSITGEAFRLSASASTDPEDDPMRFSWSCVRTGDAIRSTPHTHGFGTVPYATPPAGAVTSLLATGPLPAPDRTYEGDFCEALGPGGRPGLASTIEGTFTKTGIYDIYLLASDPVHPSTSGKFHFVVTDPDERPNATLTFPFAGKFQGGVGSAVQDGYQQAMQNEGTEVYDYVEHSFSLPLDGVTGTLKVEKTSDPSTQATLSWILSQGGTNLANGTDGEETPLVATILQQGSFVLHITLEAGLDVDYAATVIVDVDMDPFKVY